MLPHATVQRKRTLLVPTPSHSCWSQGSSVQVGPGIRHVPLCIELTNSNTSMLGGSLQEFTTKFLEASSAAHQKKAAEPLCAMLELLGQQAEWSDRMQCTMQQSNEANGLSHVAGSKSADCSLLIYWGFSGESLPWTTAGSTGHCHSGTWH